MAKRVETQRKLEVNRDNPTDYHRRGKTTSAYWYRSSACLSAFQNIVNVNIHRPVFSKELLETHSPCYAKGAGEWKQVSVLSRYASCSLREVSSD